MESPLFAIAPQSVHTKTGKRPNVASSDINGGMNQHSKSSVLVSVTRSYCTTDPSGNIENKAIADDSSLQFDLYVKKNNKKRAGASLNYSLLTIYQ